MHTNLYIAFVKVESLCCAPETNIIIFSIIDGETVGTEADFIFLGSKITADGDCSHEKKKKDAYS